MKLRENIKIVMKGNKKHSGRKIIKNCGGGNKISMQEDPH